MADVVFQRRRGSARVRETFAALAAQEKGKASVAHDEAPELLQRVASSCLADFGVLKDQTSRKRLAGHRGVMQNRANQRSPFYSSTSGS